MLFASALILAPAPDGECVADRKPGDAGPLWCLEQTALPHSALFGKFSAGIGLESVSIALLPIVTANAGVYYADKSSLIVGARANVDLGIFSVFGAGPMVGKTFYVSGYDQFALLAGVSYVAAACTFCFSSGGSGNGYRTVGIPIEAHWLFYLPSAPYAGLGFNLSGLVSKDIRTASFGIAMSVGKM